MRQRMHAGWLGGLLLAVGCTTDLTAKRPVELDASSAAQLSLSTNNRGLCSVSLILPSSGAPVTAISRLDLLTSRERSALAANSRIVDSRESRSGDEDLTRLHFWRFETKTGRKVLDAHCVVDGTDGLRDRALEAFGANLSRAALPRAFMSGGMRASIFTTQFITCRFVDPTSESTISCDGESCHVWAQAANRGDVDGASGRVANLSTLSYLCDNGCEIYQSATYFCGSGGTNGSIDAGNPTGGGGGATGPSYEFDPNDTEPCDDDGGSELSLRLSPPSQSLLFHPEVLGPYVTVTGGPSAGDDDSPCVPFQDCFSQVSASRSLAIWDAALASGEWVYTQGGAKGGIEPAVNIPSRYGDCTDYTRNATKEALGSDWQHPKASTSMLVDIATGKLSSTAYGYVGIPQSAARIGDIVVQGQHAGVYVGASADGKVWGWANNGIPAKPSSPNIDKPTGRYPFTGTLANPVYFLRPVVPCG